MLRDTFNPSNPLLCSDDKFEAAWMDSGDEREAAKLNEKPSGQIKIQLVCIRHRLCRPYLFHESKFAISPLK